MSIFDLFGSTKEDQKHWIHLGFRKYIRMTKDEIRERWDELAECIPPHKPPAQPKNDEVLDLIVEELKLEREIFYDHTRSKELGKDQYFSKKILEAWGAPR